MFETGKCYSIVLNGERVRFKVYRTNGYGLVESKRCDNNQVIVFNQNELYTVELNTIEEINCDEC
jgi:hypothetical protein